MPYRAVFITLITVTLALLVVGLWMRAISPLLAEVNASTQPSTTPGNVHPGIEPASAPTTMERPGVAATQVPPTTATSAATKPKPDPERPDREFKGLVKAVMFATFLIVVLLFAICLFTTLWTWMRRPARSKRTRYVDAWKIAGERLQPPPGDGQKDDVG